jgi:hypothetical protein
MLQVQIDPAIKTAIENFHLPDQLGFGQIMAPVMASCNYENGKWGPLEIMPYGPISMYPNAKVLHYAQEISKQFSDTNRPVSSNDSDVNNKKRSLTETPTKGAAESNKKILNQNKGKKSKTDTHEIKPKIKSIDNYFKKLNK